MRMTGWIAVGLVAVPVLLYGAFLVYGQMIERPAYTVAEEEGRLELRDYPAQIAAEIETNGTRRPAVSAGFSPLASYIFAKDREGPKIAMTAPVTQEPIGQDSWRVRFLMPESWSMTALPQPSNDRVSLVEVPPGRFAAIRFSGVPDDQDFAKEEKTLRAWVAEQGLATEGEAIFAYYNDPMTPGPLRRNEVLLRVAR